MMKRIFKHHKLFPLLPLMAMICGFSSIAQAEVPKQGLSGGDIKAILPVLRAHEMVGLTESNASGAPTSMSIAVRVNASRQTVFDLFRNPDNYYFISTLFKENTKLDETENAFAWSWASRHKLFSFTGTNRISLFPPRRADITIITSTVGSADFSLYFYEDGPDHSIFVITGYLDVNSSEWLIRYLIGNSKAMKRAMNVSIAMVIALGTKSLAEKVQKGQAPSVHRTKGKAGGMPRLLTKAELELLRPLVARGQVLLSDSHGGGRLRQATVIDEIRAPAARVTEAVSVPANYAKHIGSISGINVISQSADATEFTWELGFSVFKLQSRNLITKATEGVLLSGMDGDLKDARWRWQISPVSEDRTIVAYHSYADVAMTTEIMASTVRREPYLEHGVMLGSNIVMMNAMKKVAQQNEPAKPTDSPSD